MLDCQPLIFQRAVNDDPFRLNQPALERLISRPSHQACVQSQTLVLGQMGWRALSGIVCQGLVVNIRT